MEKQVNTKQMNKFIYIRVKDEGLRIEISALETLWWLICVDKTKLEVTYNPPPLLSTYPVPQFL